MLFYEEHLVSSFDSHSPNQLGAMLTLSWVGWKEEALNEILITIGNIGTACHNHFPGLSEILRTYGVSAESI